MNIVAHADDDLLFLSPDLIKSIQAGEYVRTVFVTAADDNNPPSYWLGRESGIREAYAQMAGVANKWSTAGVILNNHSIQLSTLIAQPKISIMFMRLPDGNSDGTGFKNDHFESLQKLWQGDIYTVRTVDGKNTYGSQDLTNTLTAVMENFRPYEIRTQDFAGLYGDGDHSDHHTVAYYTRLASRDYSMPHILIGYEDYTTFKKLPNVLSADYSLKYATFLTYARHDKAICDQGDICQQEQRSFKDWTARQYKIGTESIRCAGDTDLVRPYQKTRKFYDTFVQQYFERPLEPTAVSCR